MGFLDDIIQRNVREVLSEKDDARARYNRISRYNYMRDNAEVSGPGMFTYDGQIYAQRTNRKQYDNHHFDEPIGRV